jgi:hypothetical protein
MEVTCEEARAHLGMETQRPWHDRALAHPTPALLRLCTIITLTAQMLIEQGATYVRSTAWYRQCHRLVPSSLVSKVEKKLHSHGLVVP